MGLKSVGRWVISEYEGQSNSATTKRRHLAHQQWPNCMDRFLELGNIGHVHKGKTHKTGTTMEQLMSDLVVTRNTNVTMLILGLV
jgi:hypothetical protein